MAEHNKKGLFGEDLALEFLIVSGFEILETNWRKGKAEIDIIFKDGETLVFLEVKTRSSVAHGAPEVAIGLKKQKLIGSAAAQYMEKIGYDWKIRFDVITVVAQNDQDAIIEHFKDAFWP